MAYYIFNHGLPGILNVDIMGRVASQLTFRNEIPGTQTLLSLLDELMRWHGTMLSSLVDHQKLVEEQRRRDKAKAKQTYDMGKALATERDERKRHPGNMTDGEQDALREYDSGKSAKRLRETFENRAPPFHGRAWIEKP